MIGFIKTMSIIGIVTFTLSGCIVVPKTVAPTQNVTKSHLYATIQDIADQLRNNQRFTTKDTGTITLTTFVELNKFTQTSSFGRILSETLFSELFIRGFNVTDFRGQGGISVKPSGEFFITRKIDNLKHEIPNTYILVGTYTRIENSILINVRIMDNYTGKIVSTASSIYKADYCKLNDNICQEKYLPNKIKLKRKIKIIP